MVSGLFAFCGAWHVSMGLLAEVGVCKVVGATMLWVAPVDRSGKTKGHRLRMKADLFPAVGRHTGRWDARFARLVGTGVGVALTGLGLAVPLAASAQIVEQERPQPTSVERPRIDDPGLSITASALATYDSNIFRTDSSREPSVDDIIVTPRVAATYKKVVGLNDIRLTADVGYSYYTQNDDRSRARIELEGTGTLRVAGICQVEPVGHFLRQQADYGDINRPIDNFQTFGRVGVRASCPRTVGFYPFAEAFRDTTRNDAAFDFADQTANTYTGGIGYNRPSIGQTRFYYTYLRSDRETIGVVNRVDRFGARFQRDVVSRFELDVDLHYLNARSRGANVEPYRGLGWDASLVFRPIPALSLTGETARKIVNDTLVPAGFAVESDYGGKAEWQFAGRTSLRAGIDHGDRTFRGDPNVIASAINSDKFTNVSVGATRKISARLDLNLDGRHISRNTDTDVNEYDVTLGTVGVSYRF